MATGSATRDSRSLTGYFDSLAPDRDRWIRTNGYYHRQLARIFSFYIPQGQSVLEVGAGTGQPLNSLKPGRGLGIDLSPQMVEKARANHPHLEFRVEDVEDLHLEEKFDYIVLADLIGFLHDVQRSLENLRQVCTPRTRIVVSYFNFVWQPIVKLAEALGLKARQPEQNWLGADDLVGIFDLAGFEVVRRNTRLLFPLGIPLLSTFCNRYLVNMPLFRHLALVNVLVARPKPAGKKRDYSVSIIIPARNEKGNIEAAVQRTPEVGASTEIVFVEGNSSDGTAQEIERVIAAYPQRKMKLVPQGAGRGKGDAVRKGFAAATGEVLMILDADLTVAPEDMPKFYEALVTGQGEFVHGSRLVYPMEKEAMRFLNMLGNKFFSMAFTYLLEQRFKDTLCGTKVLFKEDYGRLALNRAYFGDFDPFGDFDLIFGAAKLNLKIVEIPIRYAERVYGETQISRFTHGWLLLRMSFFALWKMKFV